MVIDTSALAAILQDEPERGWFNQSIETAERRAMLVTSFVETSMIIESRFGAEGVRDLDLFIAMAGIDLVPVDVDRAHLARTAFRNFGKRRHPAGLIHGDCFSHALARTLDEPLRFKGADFSLTDAATWPLSSQAGKLHLPGGGAATGGSRHRQAFDTSFSRFPARSGGETHLFT